MPKHLRITYVSTAYRLYITYVLRCFSYVVVSPFILLPTPSLYIYIT